MLQISDVCLHYKQSQILFNVSLSVEKGSINCVIEQMVLVKQAY